MKKLLIIGIAILLFACQERKEVHTTITKEVIDKHEGTESDTHYEYNILRGKWCLVPKIRTAYYLIYSDRTHEEVSMDDYLFTKVGDKRSKVVTTYKYETK
jgi:hypothetical protein